jgi:hypothetical protein
LESLVSSLVRIALYLLINGLIERPVIGLTSFLIIRMWFGKAVDDFNTSIASQGQQGPHLIAATGNAFTSESKAILV